MRNFVYWLGFGVLVIPAITGILAGCTVLAVATILYFIVCALAVAVLVLLCLPVVIWCAFFDAENFNTLRLFTKTKADLN